MILCLASCSAVFFFLINVGLRIRGGGSSRSISRSSSSVGGLHALISISKVLKDQVATSATYTELAYPQERDKPIVLVLSLRLKCCIHESRYLSSINYTIKLVVALVILKSLLVEILSCHITVASLREDELTVVPLEHRRHTAKHSANYPVTLDKKSQVMLEQSGRCCC